MRRKLPPLNALRSFEAIGRHGSISQAAKELLVTEPAVSRALKTLEDHFGLALFLRHSSGLALTEQGKLLLPEVSDALDRIALASSLIYEQRRYSISILATPFIAAHWLTDRIGPFLNDNSDVSIRIHSSFRYEELQRAEFDVAIWNTTSDKKGFRREHLFARSRVPMCSGDFAERFLADGDPSALADCTLIHEYDYGDWMTWFEAAGMEKDAAARGLVSDNFEAILQAAIKGAGVALLFETSPADQLSSPALIRPIPSDVALETDYSIFIREKTQDNPAIAWLAESLISR